MLVVPSSCVSFSSPFVSLHPHRTLLAYDALRGVFYSLDSMNTYAPSVAAKTMANKLTTVIKQVREGWAKNEQTAASASSPSSSSSSSAPSLVPLSCSQQRNNSDCGVFVLAFAESIAQAALQGASAAGSIAALQSHLTARVSQESVETKRRDIATVIRTQAEEQRGNR